MESAMKHPIYRPIAIGALLALASLSARAAEPKDEPAKPEMGAVMKISQAGQASITLPA
jgi:hypothetical protein